MNEPYKLLVIGGGAAGLTASAFGGELGAKVALIEKAHLGGDCTWVGCVPSKALLKVAKVAHAMRTADKFGITAVEPTVDMLKVRERLQGIIDEIYQHETPDVFSQRGVEVIEGTAEFIDPYHVQVGERVLESQKFVIATGAHPLVPTIDGLDTIDYHTNDTLFDNTRLPEHLIVMGAGAIGMEMGQAYSRLGAKVTIVGAEVMPRDDHHATETLVDVFEREGITVVRDFITRFEKTGEQHFVAMTKSGDTLEGDMLLVAVGRAPTVHGLGLDAAGVAYGDRGIPVNDHLQTNQPHIYAVGDVTDGAKLTHIASFQGSVAARNALFPLINSKGKPDFYPWVTYTDPEVAQAGLTESAARAKHGKAVKTYVLPLTEGDRALAEGATDGFVKIVYKGSNQILGATIVAERAGEMIQEFMYVDGIRELTTKIHAYPTYADVTQKAALQASVKELLSGTTGRVIDTASKLLW